MDNLEQSLDEEKEIEMLECPEHGFYPADECLCGACEAIEQAIDEAIEREHKNEKTN